MKLHTMAALPFALVALVTLVLAPPATADWSSSEKDPGWNRAVVSLQVVGETYGQPGSHQLQAVWELAMLKVAERYPVDLSTELILEVNGTPVLQRRLTIEVVDTHDCDGAPGTCTGGCGTLQEGVQSLALQCHPSPLGSSPPEDCECKAVITTSMGGHDLTSGDRLQLRLRAAPGAGAETIVSDDLFTTRFETSRYTGPGFFGKDPNAETRALAHTALKCDGRVGRVIDAADEAVHATPAIFGTGPGGGEGGQFDPTPVLSISGVSLEDGECLDAHLSVIVGGARTYGVARLALFQVTLTPAGGGPRHMVGHYETPYGIPSPAVALEAERDVDMLAANFFQRVGNGHHEIPPGVYTVDVWWAGAPPGVPGGAIGAAFVLKLYLRG